MSNTQTHNQHTLRELGERAGMTRGELRTALEDGALPPECIATTATGRRCVADLEGGLAALAGWRQKRAARALPDVGDMLPRPVAQQLLAAAGRLREEAARLEALVGGGPRVTPMGVEAFTRPHIVSDRRGTHG